MNEEKSNKPRQALLLTDLRRTKVGGDLLGLGMDLSKMVVARGKKVVAEAVHRLDWATNEK